MKTRWEEERQLWTLKYCSTSSTSDHPEETSCYLESNQTVVLDEVIDEDISTIRDYFRNYLDDPKEIGIAYIFHNGKGVAFEDIFDHAAVKGDKIFIESQIL